MVEVGTCIVSVIVPTLDEARTLPMLLHDLRALSVPYEVVVADGGSRDDTAAVAERCGARLVRAARGRGAQLAAGADAARAPLLCFLHADVRLPPAALRELERLARDGARGAHAFRLAIDAPSAPFRLVEWATNVRSRLAGLPYGDQGLVVSRADYDACGGFHPLPLMEDVAIARALRRVTTVSLLPAAVVVSPRRWQRDGIVRRTLANWLFLLAYFAGVAPARLAARYHGHRASDAD